MLLIVIKCKYFAAISANITLKPSYSKTIKHYNLVLSLIEFNKLFYFYCFCS